MFKSKNLIFDWLCFAAVYIHHDQSIQSNVFCSQLLCADSIVSYLNEQFVCWAWDITSDKNRNRYCDTCLIFNGVILQRMASPSRDTARYRFS